MNNIRWQALLLEFDWRFTVGRRGLNFSISFFFLQISLAIFALHFLHVATTARRFLRSTGCEIQKVL